MVAFTTAKQLTLAANSSYVGTWDQPTNQNWAVVDAALGGFVDIALNNSPVTLSTPQFQSAMITFSSTLTGDVAITFPSTFQGFYTILNNCTGNNDFVITLGTTVASGQNIACMPGTPFDIINDGTNIRFRNLERIGTYWDYGGDEVPRWINNCTIPPYLVCDGSNFSSADYPVLFEIFGDSDELPDARGRARFGLNEGTNRITNGGSGIDGNSLHESGGDQASQQHDHSFSDSFSGNTGIENTNHDHTWSPTASEFVQGSGSVEVYGKGSGSKTTGLQSANHGHPFSGSVSGNTGDSGGGGSENMPPAYIGGITMIRAG